MDRQAATVGEALARADTNAGKSPQKSKRCPFETGREECLHVVKSRTLFVALAVAAGALAMGASASALTLADLVAGESVTAGNGVVYDAFTVKVKGGLSSDLADYTVLATPSGFRITGDVSDEARGRKAGKGKITLTYGVTTDDPAGLLGGELRVQSGEQMALVSALKKIFDGKKRLGKLSVESGGSLLDELELAGLADLLVKERIRLGAGFSGGTVTTGFAAVPEPGTLALVGLGVAALGALRRR